MPSTESSDVFCLYLWRSVEAPGTVYLARSIQNAEAVCRELIGYGYLVKVLHVASDTEFVLSDGTLAPVRVRVEAPQRDSTETGASTALSR
jgi:hypothetical protein